MLTITKNILTAFALLVIFSTAAFAQQPTPQPAPRADDNYVTEKGFKSKVFEVKYRDATSLGHVLRQLGSGFKGASVYPNSEFKTITVRDFPENLATIEEALKRLDVPGAPRPNIELHMYVLLASNSGANAPAASGEIPNELKGVLTQLRETLNYRNYDLATTIVQRLTQTQHGLRGRGTTEITRAPNPSDSVRLPYEYSLSSVSIVSNSENTTVLQIGEFTFNTGVTAIAHTAGLGTQIQTALNLRDGEKVVVGTATLGDRALIIVLTARFIK